jgi:hypothetical protein
MQTLKYKIMQSLDKKLHYLYNVPIVYVNICI